MILREDLFYNHLPSNCYKNIYLSKLKYIVSTNWILKLRCIGKIDWFVSSTCYYENVKKMVVFFANVAMQRLIKMAIFALKHQSWLSFCIGIQGILSIVWSLQWQHFKWFHVTTIQIFFDGRIVSNTGKCWMHIQRMKLFNMPFIKRKTLAHKKKNL